MAYIFFYIYLIFIGIVLFICNYYRPLKLRHIIIGITSAAYSVAFDMIFGDWLGLYYYLDLRNSTFYMVLSGIFIYPVLNMLYTLFLPTNRAHFLTYTGMWIVGMIVFEYLSIVQKIIVFTGWKPIPLSLGVYAFTYLWVNLLYNFLKRTPKLV